MQARPPPDPAAHRDPGPLLHEFLRANSAELIERCRAKVARRRAPRPTVAEMDHGIPLFLTQLIETLRAEQQPGKSHRANAAPSSEAVKMAAGAASHGRELLRHGFSIEQVVHDYGDLCQAATELALEKHASVSVSEFQTLNRCLDDAIAEAVQEFWSQGDRTAAEDCTRESNERLGALAHELRNHLSTAMLSLAAIKRGGVGITGATSAVLDRSLLGLRGLIDGTLADVRLSTSDALPVKHVPVGRFLADVQAAASLEAEARGCEFSTLPTEAGLVMIADPELLYSAVSNLLQNAFKFTRPNTHVVLGAQATDDRVRIEVEDQCGGIHAGVVAKLFEPFAHSQGSEGLGLGLSISRRAAEAMGGTLSVRNLPGEGCIFTIDLPRVVGS